MMLSTTALNDRCAHLYEHDLLNAGEAINSLISMSILIIGDSKSDNQSK